MHHGDDEVNDSTSSIFWYTQPIWASVFQFTSLVQTKKHKLLEKDLSITGCISEFADTQ